MILAGHRDFGTCMLVALVVSAAQPRRPEILWLATATAIYGGGGNFLRLATAYELYGSGSGGLSITLCALFVS